MFALVLVPIDIVAAPKPARAKHAMVASQHELASKVGVDIMKRGGNAVDAAIAVGIALAVVYPEAGNIGGGGFMLIRKRNGETRAIDYREMAPGAAGRDVFVDKDGNLIRGEGGSTVGYRASGVPGTLAGYDLSSRPVEQLQIGYCWHCEKSFVATAITADARSSANRIVAFINLKRR